LLAIHYNTPIFFFSNTSLNENFNPATAALLDGIEVSTAILTAVQSATQAHVLAGGRKPGLAVVLVGSDPASSIYVRAKRKDCERAGLSARDFDLPADISQAELLSLIDDLNRDEAIHGILVQLPLPSHIDEIAITNSINALKDVDGFHAFSVGRLALRQPGHSVPAHHVAS
jgi:methylenetetrahydrofolate dehydrogenase (NADP+)/methenyltetrahydrofolate cyclohydrolase